LLDSSNLRGTLPDAIGTFTGLTFFDVHTNELTGSIPATVGNWKQLTTFEVDNNQLTGSIPATVANWKKLENLGVRINQLSGGVLPPLPFDQMKGHCFLFEVQWPQGAMNAFTCPWPQGATKKCKEVSGSDWIPITDSDCSCTGNSTHLATEQCYAWGQLFDSTNGTGWTGHGKGCSRTDPCGCCPLGAGLCSIICSADGTSITFMYVLPSPSPLLPPPLLPRTSPRTRWHIRAC
jgi:hypothetical protein